MPLIRYLKHLGSGLSIGWRRSEALLSLVLQDVTALSSSFLCAMWLCLSASLVSVHWYLYLSQYAWGLAASSSFKVIILKGSSSREVGWDKDGKDVHKITSC